MEFPAWLNPDFYVQKLLAVIFGPASLAVFLFLFVKMVLSWVDAARSVVELGRTTRSAAVRVVARICGTPAGRRRLGLLLSAAMVVAQLLWGYLAYVVGNIVSSVVGVAPFGHTDLSRLTVAQFFGLLRWDPVSSAYVGLCVVALVFAYRTARQRHRRTGLATVLSLPVFPIALFGTLGATLVLLDYLGALDVYSNVFTGGQVILAYVMGASAIGYILVTRAALGTPGMVSGYWRDTAHVPR